MLFQAYFAKRIESELEVSVVLNCNLVDPLVIEEAKAILGKEFEKKFVRLGGLFLKNRFWLSLLTRLRVWPFFIEKEEDVLISIDNIKLYRFIFGYFQSFRYLPENFTSHLNFGDLITPKNKDRIDRITDGDVFVHLRLGDYTSASAIKYHGVLGSSYYKRAVREFSDRKRVIVLTNDPVNAHQIMSNVVDVKLEIWSNNEYTGLDDFILLSHARALAIGNSSYSLLAGLIAHENQNAQVIAPRKWFVARPINTNFRFPEDWNLF